MSKWFFILISIYSLCIPDRLMLLHSVFFMKQTFLGHITQWYYFCSFQILCIVFNRNIVFHLFVIWFLLQCYSYSRIFFFIYWLFVTDIFFWNVVSYFNRQAFQKAHKTHKIWPTNETVCSFNCFVKFSRYF